MSKRKHDRFVRRLETEFSADGKNYRGISSDLSRSGLFIRTNHAFPVGTLIDILIHLPDGTSSKLKGNVRRALKTPVVSIKNGMGVELTEIDSFYTKFMATFLGTEEDASDQIAPTQRPVTIQEVSEVPQQDPAEYMIVACTHCKARNKVRSSKMSFGPRCGRCGHPLFFSV